MSQTFESTNATPAPIFLADHPVLDFLNTVAIIDSQPVEFLQTDADVLRWLERAGLRENGAMPKLAPSTLLTSARTLREQIRVLIDKRHSGRRADTAAFNVFLVQASSYPQLVWEGRKDPRIERVREQKTAQQVLSRLAEAAANLLANGNFELIHKCEDESCVLMFYDRTKSHRRRWCSMAACGNRNKVKAFRQRQQA